MPKPVMSCNSTKVKNASIDMHYRKSKCQGNNDSRQSAMSICRMLGRRVQDIKPYANAVIYYHAKKDFNATVLRKSNNLEAATE